MSDGAGQLSRLLRAGVLVLLATGGAAASEPDRAWRLAGGDANAWIVINSPDPDSKSGGRVVQMLHARRSADPKSTLSPLWNEARPLTGNVGQIAASRDELLILFSDDSLCAVLPHRGAAPVPRPPGDATIRVLAGDSAGADFYAIVRSQRGGLLDEPATRAASAPSGPRLLRWDGANWHEAAELPTAVARAERLWAAAREGRVLVLYSAGERTKTASGPPGRESDPVNSAGGHASVHWTEWTSSGWREPEPIPNVANAGEVWAGWRSGGPTVLVAEPSDGGATVRLLLREGDAWRDQGRLHDGAAPLAYVKDRIDITVAHDRLLLARSDQRRVRIGWADAAADSKVTWDKSGVGSDSSALRWSEGISLAIMLGMLALLVFLRPDRLTAATPLPANMTPATPVWRLLATIIDVLPAIVLTAYWWVPPVRELLQRTGFGATMDHEEFRRIVERELWWAGMLIIGVYALYCFVWEATLGTTPGKQLVRCRVVDQSGQRPSLRQIAVRNLIRVPELASPFMMMCTLFLMLVGSARRQRVGDMLAGTLVVAQTVPQARPVEEGGAPPRGGGPGAGDA